jgi:hypothetical protein
MTRDDGAVSVAIKTNITHVVRGVADKDTTGRARGEFMWSGGGEIGVA